MEATTKVAISLRDEMTNIDYEAGPGELESGAMAQHRIQRHR
jgi:hypothetical protein